MSTLGRLLYGTNTGNLFVEINSKDGGFIGTLRFADDRGAVVVYDITGTFDGTTIQFSGEPKQTTGGVEVGKIDAKAILTPTGQSRGEWSSSIGTGGTFVLFPQDLTAQSQPRPGMPPEQIHTAIRSLGAINLYAEDVVELIGFLARDFSQGRVVVTYNERGNEISRYASDFETDFDRLGEIKYLKMVIQEPEAYGINRLATVELNAAGKNEVRVQGVQEAWVRGKAKALASQLKLNEKTLATTYRRFGLNINALLAFAVLVLLPELPLLKRISFLAFMVLVGWALARLHCLLRAQRRNPVILARSPFERPNLKSFLGCFRSQPLLLRP